MVSTAFTRHAEPSLWTRWVVCRVTGLVVFATLGSGCSDVDVATTPQPPVAKSPNRASPSESTQAPVESTQPQDTQPAASQSAELDAATGSSDSASTAGAGTDTAQPGDSRQPEKSSLPAGEDPSQPSSVTEKDPDEVVVDSATGPADAAMSHKIRQGMDALRSESAKIQVVGRALSPSEQSRVKDLAQAIEYLEASLQALAPTVTKTSSDVTEDAAVNAEQLIDELIKSTDVSIAEIQVVGRAMTDAELSRARTLLRVADGLRRAVGEIALETTGGRPQPDLLNLLPD